MSIADDAQQLISHAGSFGEQGAGVTNVARDSLNGAMQALQQVNNMATESMSTVHSLLGSNHAGVGSVGATANAVTHTAEDVIGAIQQAIESVMALDQAISSHSNTVSSIGHQLLQGT